MIDKKRASTDEYDLAVAQFLFDLLDDESDEKLTVLIDCRPTVGQPNVLIPRLLSMIQQIARTMSNHFPERFECVMAYPVPYTLTVFFSMVRPFLSAKSAEKVTLLVGPSTTESACPVKLGRTVSLEALRVQDRPRHAALADYQEPA